MKRAAGILALVAMVAAAAEPPSPQALSNDLVVARRALGDANWYTAERRAAAAAALPSLRAEARLQQGEREERRARFGCLRGQIVRIEQTRRVHAVIQRERGYGIIRREENGQGAGKGPTASNILRDLDMIRLNPTAAMLPEGLERAKPANKCELRFYVRLPKDKGDLLSGFAQSCEEQGEEKLFETKPMTLPALFEALKGIEDKFIMIL